jgi:hypothetical protein
MKKTSIVAYLCMSILFLCSCEFTKWDNYEDLVGEWHSNDPFIKKSKLIFYKDGTCVVENVPIKEVDPWKNEHYSLLWKEGRGNKKFQEKVKTMDNWNFHGYWVVKEDTLYDPLKQPYYRYKIWMSPYQEMLGTDQMRDSFMNYTDVDDAFWVSIDAWTDSFFPPARLHYLSFYTIDPDEFYCFSK